MSLQLKDDPSKASSSSNSYTVEEFDQLLAKADYADRLLELINGKLTEKMPTEEHGVTAGNIVFALRGYVQIHKSGRVGVEVRHRMPDDQWNSLLPDISYSTARRTMVTQGSVPTMPDLAVEVQSPNDSIKAMREKAAYYLAHGSKLVWLIYPRKQLVEVFYVNGEIDIFHAGETLSGEEVLPDFKLPVAEIFADPFAE